ncbi:MAG: cation transporter [Roseivirga sp.]|nr:cation transporter [Roseivirga sp.]
MGHHHHHHGHHHHHDHGVKNLKVAFFLNLGFTIIEIVGGIMTNSLAILSDALHDLGDSLSIGLSWYFQKLSTKKGDEIYSYGYKRFSLLGAIINAVVLLVGSVFILTEAIPALFDPGLTDAKGMMYLAIFGVVVNGAAVLRLKKGTSINEKVISLHLLEDVLGWVAVLIGSVVMLYFDAPWIDPLLSVLIALFILFNVYKSLKASLGIILQATPQDIDIPLVHEKLKGIPQIRDVHDCHIWSMDGEYHVLSAHLVLNGDYTLEEMAEIKAVAKELLKEEVEHVTIEFEGPHEECKGC